MVYNASCELILLLYIQYKREISDKIRVYAGEFPVIILTGARQVGKTTLLREMFPTYEYVSLDIPSTAQMASENPDLFLKALVLG